MFWSRSRSPAAFGVRLRLDPLLEDRCVPCSGHEAPAAVTAAQVAVAPPAAVAPAAAPAAATASAVAADPARSLATVAPPAAGDRVGQPVTAAVPPAADTSSSESDLLGCPC